MGQQFIFQITGLTKKHAQKKVLENVQLAFYPGAKIGVLGKNGSGKSTLLRLINRLEEPCGGRIMIDGTDVTALDAAGLRDFRRKIGMICQHFNLLASKTVGNIVAMPSKLASEQPINPLALIYLNRLSDLLFVMARYFNDQGKRDILWQPGKNR